MAGWGTISLRCQEEPPPGGAGAGRRGDGETGRRGDGEMGRRGDEGSMCKDPEPTLRDAARAPSPGRPPLARRGHATAGTPAVTGVAPGPVAAPAHAAAARPAVPPRAGRRSPGRPGAAVGQPGPAVVVHPPPSRYHLSCLLTSDTRTPSSSSRSFSSGRRRPAARLPHRLQSWPERQPAGPVSRFAFVPGGCFFDTNAASVGVPVLPSFQGG